MCLHQVGAALHKATRRAGCLLLLRCREAVVVLRQWWLVQFWHRRACVAAIARQMQVETVPLPIRSTAERWYEGCIVEIHLDGCLGCFQQQRFVQQVASVADVAENRVNVQCVLQGSVLVQLEIVPSCHSSAGGTSPRQAVERLLRLHPHQLPGYHVTSVSLVPPSHAAVSSRLLGMAKQHAAQGLMWGGFAAWQCAVRSILRERALSAQHQEKTASVQNTVEVLVSHIAALEDSQQPSSSQRAEASRSAEAQEERTQLEAALKQHVQAEEFELAAKVKKRIMALGGPVSEEESVQLRAEAAQLAHANLQQKSRIEELEGQLREHTADSEAQMQILKDQMRQSARSSPQPAASATPQQSSNPLSSSLLDQYSNVLFEPLEELLCHTPGVMRTPVRTPVRTPGGGGHTPVDHRFLVASLLDPDTPSATPSDSSSIPSPVTGRADWVALWFILSSLLVSQRPVLLMSRVSGAVLRWRLKVVALRRPLVMRAPGGAWGARAEEGLSEEQLGERVHELRVALQQVHDSHSIRLRFVEPCCWDLLRSVVAHIVFVEDWV